MIGAFRPAVRAKATRVASRCVLSAYRPVIAPSKEILAVCRETPGRRAQCPTVAEQPASTAFSVH